MESLKAQGNAELKAGRISEALEAYTSALALDPQSFRAQLMAGTAPRVHRFLPEPQPAAS